MSFPNFGGSGNSGSQFNFGSVTKSNDPVRPGFTNPQSYAQPILSTGQPNITKSIGFGFPSGGVQQQSAQTTSVFGQGAIQTQNAAGGTSSTLNFTGGFNALKQNIAVTQEKSNITALTFKPPQSDGAKNTTSEPKQNFFIGFGKPNATESRDKNASPTQKAEQKPVFGFNFQQNETKKDEKPAFTINSTAQPKTEEAPEVKTTVATVIKSESEDKTKTTIQAENIPSSLNAPQKPTTSLQQLSNQQNIATVQPQATKSNSEIVSEQRKRYDELQKALKDVNVIRETESVDNVKLEFQDDAITTINSAVNEIFDTMEKKLSNIFTLLSQNVQEQVKEYVQQETESLIKESVNQQQLESQLYDKIQRDIQAISNDIEVFKVNWIKQQQTYQDSLTMLLKKRDGKQSPKDMLDINNIALTFVIALFATFIMRIVKV